MNFKTSFTYIILFFLYATTYPNEKPLSACREIKQLDPQAPFDKYQSAVIKIHENGLSVCACITYLAKTRRERAYKKLSEEYTPKKWSEIESNIAKDIDLYNNNIARNPKITCDENVSPEMCSLTGNRYIEHGLKQNLYIHNNPDVPSIAAVVGHPANSVSPTYANHIVYNPAYCRIFSSHETRTILDHEFQHLKQKASIIDIHIPNRVGTNYYKLIRSWEAEADRIPTACNELEDALHQLSVSEKGKTSWNRFMKYIYDEHQLKKLDKLHSRTHPSSIGRWEWAARIYKLKLVEKNYLKK
jgi:hypothetical protein